MTQAQPLRYSYTYPGTPGPNPTQKLSCLVGEIQSSVPGVTHPLLADSINYKSLGDIIYCWFLNILCIQSNQPTSPINTWQSLLREHPLPAMIPHMYTGHQKGCYTSSLNWATPGCPWGWLLWEQCTTLTWRLGRSKAWIQTFSLLQTQKASQTFDCTLLLFCLHHLTSEESFISSLQWGVWT